MPQRANVASIEAIDTFRANLVVYTAQARAALEEVSSDVMRTRVWLESEQRTFWENHLRRRKRNLEQAQQALFSARLSKIQQPSPLDQMAVQRARAAVEEAEGKLRTIKLWLRDFDQRVQPQVKQMEKLHTVLTNDMVQAIASLSQTVKTLSEYTEIAAPNVSVLPSPTSGGGEGTVGGPGGDDKSKA